MALVAALVFAMLAASLFVVGIQITQSALKEGRNTKSNAQVYNVALAGITHAANWLQRQPNPPVTCFDPKSNANSPDDDPETSQADEQLGLVNEFVVDARNNMWGRYEVGRSSTGPVAAPARGGLVTQTGSHSALYATPPTWTAEDVSKQRGESAGTVWRVRSRAYLFRRPTPGTPFSLSGTKPLQQMTLEADIRRGKFNYHQAAIYNYAPDSTPPDVNGYVLDIHAHDAIGNTVVQALDGSGYIWWTRTTNIGTSMYSGFNIAGPTLSGANNPTSAAYVADGIADQLSFYFAVPDTGTLKGMADAYYEDEDSIPQPVNAKPQLVYIKPSNGTVQFGGGGSHPNLSGSGVLFVDGNLTISGSGTAQTWNGLIFVLGDYDQEMASKITGSLVCGTHFRIHGYAGKVAQVLYSPSTLDSINAQIGSYRVMRSTVRAVDDAAASRY